MGQAQTSLRDRISGMDERWQAAISGLSRIEGGQIVDRMR